MTEDRIRELNALVIVKNQIAKFLSYSDKAPELLVSTDRDHSRIVLSDKKIIDDIKVTMLNRYNEIMDEIENE